MYKFKSQWRSIIFKRKKWINNRQFEIKFRNDGTYIIKNIDLDIYIGVSNIQLRDEFNIPLKEYYLKFTKNFEGINQKDIFYQIEIIIII